MAAADVASADYAEGARQHKMLQARAERRARKLDLESGIAQQMQREATAQLMVDKANELRAAAGMHQKAAEILNNAARWEMRS